MAVKPTCRQCREEYTPSPYSTDDGFCSDPCEKQWDAEISLDEDQHAIDCECSDCD